MSRLLHRARLLARLSSSPSKPSFTTGQLRSLHTAYPHSQWHAATSNPSSRLQIYTSLSNDPYQNLATEHFLLQSSHPDSTVLFLYINDPCVVIGRNQNPWVEVNLGMLSRFEPAPGSWAGVAEAQDHAQHVSHSGDFTAAAITNEGNFANDYGGRSQQKTSPLDREAAPKRRQPASKADRGIPLVRRRSGGGTVFHDAGNVNWSVICPPSQFDRDKHAEMIVRALQNLGLGKGVRVNDRHDIVVNQLGYPVRSDKELKVVNNDFKISGSAYKLTRLRSLHHGTCLLTSPNLGEIGELLRSPAAPYIHAKGVESVRSPVRNIAEGTNIGTEEFCEAVRMEFARMYGGKVDVIGRLIDTDMTGLTEIKDGIAELQSPKWLYDQTPAFTFSTHPTEEDPRERPRVEKKYWNKTFKMTSNFRHGMITGGEISYEKRHVSIPEQSADDPWRLRPRNYWIHFLADKSVHKRDQPNIAYWLNTLLGTEKAAYWTRDTNETAITAA